MFSVIIDVRLTRAPNLRILLIMYGQRSQQTILIDRNRKRFLIDLINTHVFFPDCYFVILASNKKHTNKNSNNVSEDLINWLESNDILMGQLYRAPYKMGDPPNIPFPIDCSVVVSLRVSLVDFREFRTQKNLFAANGAFLAVKTSC